MESLIATDWLKDYDPLFDLFDEEMRGNDGQTTATASNYHPNCLTTAAAAATCNGLDYFSEIGADLNSNQYCYNPFKQQTDELSLILGLECMPLGLDLNSPASTSSSYSSTNSSSAASSTSAYTSPNSSTITNNNSNNTKVNSNNTYNNNNNNNNISINGSSNNDAGGVSVDRGNGGSGATAVAAVTAAASMNYIVTNGSPSPFKKKKKNTKPRGTSLLAQPSPKTSKLNLNSTPSSLQTTTATIPTISLTSIRQITTTSRPLSTLLTINKQQTNISSNTNTLNTPSIRSPHHHHLLSLPPHSNITSYSSLYPNSQQVLRKQNVTNTTNTTTISTKTNHTPTRLGQRHQSLVSISTPSTQHLTELEKAVRYCVKIEHAYSLLS